MPVELYWGRNFDTPHERRALGTFFEAMRAKFGSGTEPILILANYMIGGNLIDLTVLKKNVVIVIELKESFDPFHATENGPWLAINNRMIGSDELNPFEQLKKYRVRWMDFFQKKQAEFPSLANHKIDFTRINGYVVISPKIHKQTRNDIPKLPWFRLVGLDWLPEAIEKEISPNFNFSEAELRMMVGKLLNLRGPIEDPLLQGAFLVPFRENDRFVGREKDLEVLHVLLQTRTGSGFRPVMLSGMGGIGKTQLAVEYAYRHKEDYPGGIYWVNVADNWINGMARLAERLDLPVNEGLGAARDRFLAYALVDKLKDHPDALLVFDNIEDPRQLLEPVEGILPYHLGCHILFTTRWRDMSLPFETIELYALPESAAMELLLSKPRLKVVLEAWHNGPEGSDPEVQAARAICRSLGYLPLALALSAAYLNEYYPRVNLSGYLNRLEHEGLKTVDDLKVDQRALPTLHDTAISATLRSQWEALSKNGDTRLVLLTAALQDEGSEIPRARLALFTGLEDAAAPGYPGLLEEGLHTLSSLWLVEELNDKEIHLHPLIRQFARSVMPGGGVNFVSERVNYLVNALWQLSRLEKEMNARGVDALLEDLRVSRQLLYRYKIEKGEFVSRLDQLMRVIDLEAHRLRDAEESRMPGFSLQQLRNRALELNYEELTHRLDVEIDKKSYPCLRERYPAGTESSALERTLVSDDTIDIQITPDSRHIISLDKHAIRVWDIESGREIRSLSKRHEVQRFRMTPDGRRVILITTELKEPGVVQDGGGDKESTIILDDSLDDEVLDTRPHQKTIKGHRFTVIPTDRCIYYYDMQDAVIRYSIWDGEKDQELINQQGDELHLNGVMEVVDDQRIVFGCKDNALMVCSISDGKVLQTLRGHNAAVTGVIVVPGGCQLVSHDLDGTFRVWEIEASKELFVFNDSGSYITGAVVSPDGTCLVAAYSGGHLRAWDLRDGKELYTIEEESLDSLEIQEDLRPMIELVKQGKQLMRGRLRIYDLAVPADESLKPVITPDNRLLITIGDFGVINVYDLHSGESLEIPNEQARIISNIAVTPDSRLAVYGYHSDETLFIGIADMRSGEIIGNLYGHGIVPPPTKIHDLKTGENLEFPYADAYNSLMLALYPEERLGKMLIAVTPDRQHIISTSGDKTIKVWRLESIIESQKDQEHRNRGFKKIIAVTPDGCLLALKEAVNIGNYPGVINHEDSLVKINSETLDVSVVLVVNEKIDGVALSSDGNRIIMAGGSTSAWDLKTGEKLQDLARASGGRYFTEIKPGIYYCLSDNRVEIMSSFLRSGQVKAESSVSNMVTGEKLYTIAMDNGELILDVVPIGSGGRIISTLEDGTVRLRDLEDGKELLLLRGHVKKVTHVALTPDGRYAVSASQDGSMRIWDIDRSRSLYSLEEYGDQVHDLVIAPDASRIAFIARDGFHVWMPGGENIVLFLPGIYYHKCVIKPDGSLLMVEDSAGALHFLDCINVG